MFFFVYVIIISEFCRIGKWGNDGWIGRRKTGIKFGIVEFFGGFGRGDWGREDLGIWREFVGELNQASAMKARAEAWQTANYAGPEAEARTSSARSVG